MTERDKVVAEDAALKTPSLGRRMASFMYEGLLLFYSSSFLVKEDGVFRPATGSEIAAVDLDQYNASRDELVDVEQHIATVAVLSAEQLHGRQEEFT